MLKVLVVFDVSEEVAKYTKRYDLIFNVTKNDFRSISSKWYRIGLRNDFDQSEFAKYHKVTSKLKPLEHGNNIYNYYFQIIENIKKDILDVVDGREAKFFVGNYFFYPTIYFTGIKEQSLFPLFLTGSCFAEAIFITLKEVGLNVSKQGKEKGKIQTLLRNKLLSLSIYLKLLLTIFSMKNNLSIKQLGSYTGKVILVRNIHQYREAKKIQALTESKILLIPSLHPVKSFSNDCYSLSKIDSLLSLIKSLKRKKLQRLNLDVYGVIKYLEYNSKRQPNYLCYKELLNLLDKKLNNDVTIISLEQLSPQAIIENETIGSTRVCVGIQTTLIELKNYYLLSPFSRFLLSDLASERFFSKLGYVNAKYDGSINYSYITKQFTQRQPDKITILTQAYDTKNFKSYLEDVINVLKLSTNYKNNSIQILVHPRESASDYNYLLPKFENIELVNSDHTLLRRISESIFVITRTTSLIQECIYMNVPVFSLLFSDSDMSVSSKASYFEACLKCYELQDLPKYIESDFSTYFSIKREEYLSTTKEVVFEKLN